MKPGSSGVPVLQFAQNAFCADGLKEVLTPHQREVNMRSRALPATAGSEERSSENMEHSASELMLVGRVGNLAESGKALKLDNSTDYDRWLHIQAGKLNWGSLLLSVRAVSSIKQRCKCESMRQQVADEPVLVINPLPVRAGDRLEDKTKGTMLTVALGAATQKVAVHAKGRR